MVQDRMAQRPLSVLLAFVVACHAGTVRGTDAPRAAIPDATTTADLTGLFAPIGARDDVVALAGAVVSSPGFLTPEQTAFLQARVISRLAPRAIYVFGSRARGDHARFADVDLMIEATDDITSLLCELRDELSNSNFPLKVDLVPIAEFPSEYRARYERDKVAWPMFTT